jgi:hypothetical protein
MRPKEHHESKHDGSSASRNLKFAFKKGITGLRQCRSTILDSKTLNTDGLKLTSVTI